VEARSAQSMEAARRLSARPLNFSRGLLDIDDLAEHRIPECRNRVAEPGPVESMKASPRISTNLLSPRWKRLNMPKLSDGRNGPLRLLK